jgi:AcrR family transcriptional regulator
VTERKRPRRTRERILEASLALFNVHGEPHITTADIADELNISPGNLYYHFRNKDEIIYDLFQAFEQRLGEALAVPEERAPDIEDLWLFLHLVFEIIWEYRFLYRDLDELASRNHRLAAHFRRIIERGTNTVLVLCRGLAKSGVLRASEREMNALACNVVMVVTYWLSYQKFRTQAKGGGDDASLELGAYQVLSLLSPYLVGNARQLIDKLGDAYLN